MEEIKKNRYHNGKIYTIRSNETDKYYIGSTCLELRKRLWSHRTGYKLFQNGKGNNMTSYEIITYDDHYIELLETYKCETKDELTKREGELIRKYKDELVNRKIEGRGSKEYYEDNKDKKKEQAKEYYKNNKDDKMKYQKNHYQDNKIVILEKQKKYHNDNKDKRNKRNLNYYYNNKAKIKQYQQQKYICDCGSELNLQNKSRHVKTKKHIDLMNKL